jgi:chain length determinant protein (polysaccharide antigen chain regulator)
MTQNNNSQVSRSNDPEQIDLLDLVLQLWRGKWTIATFVVVFIALLLDIYRRKKMDLNAIIAQPDALRLQPILMH